MVPIALLVRSCEAEINDVNLFTSLIGKSGKKVIRFYVAMNKSSLVYFLDSFNHLDSNVQH